MNSSTKLRAAALFGSLSHPVRISVVELLGESEMSVTEIATALDIGQSSASQHLAVLQRAGILAVTPRGTSRMYRLRGPRIAAIVQLIAEFCSVHGLRGEPTDEPEGL